MERSRRYFRERQVRNGRKKADGFTSTLGRYNNSLLLCLDTHPLPTSDYSFDTATVRQQSSYHSNRAIRGKTTSGGIQLSVLRGPVHNAERTSSSSHHRSCARSIADRMFGGFEIKEGDPDEALRLLAKSVATSGDWKAIEHVGQCV